MIIHISYFPPETSDQRGCVSPVSLRNTEEDVYVFKAIYQRQKLNTRAFNWHLKKETLSEKYSEPHEITDTNLLCVCSHIFIILFTKEQVNIFQSMHLVKEMLPTKQAFYAAVPKVSTTTHTRLSQPQ